MERRDREAQRSDALLTALAVVLEDGRDRLSALLDVARRADGPEVPEQRAPSGGPATSSDRRVYRQRLARLDADVAAAEDAGDLGALVRAVSERERLLAELGGLLGLLGRPRGSAS